MRPAHDIIDAILSVDEVSDAEFERMWRIHMGIPDPGRFVAPRTSLKVPAVQRERERRAAQR